MLKEEQQDKILSTLKENKDSGGDGMTLEDLARHLGIPLADLDYYIDGLSKKGYVNSGLSMGGPSRHYITPKGTGHLLGDSE